MTKLSADANIDVDLDSILTAWHEATVRLQQTHEALRCEVQRLTQELEEKNRQLARKNRLADLGQMASHIAHEVRNNLVPVTLYLSLLRRRIQSDPQALEILDKIHAAFCALELMVNDLLHFSSDRQPVCRPFKLAELLEEVLSQIEPQSQAQKVLIKTQVDPTVVLNADKELIRRALLNLLFNALDAMPTGGILSVTVQRTDFALEISVKDTGPGLSEEATRRAFEPFFTTKPNGIGLGLAIVYRIAEAHGATVTAENHKDGGAQFTLHFPLASEETHS